MKLNIPKYIQKLSPCLPEKTPEQAECESGGKDTVTLASNENPWGPSPRVVAALRESLSSLHRYPDGSCHSLVSDIAGHFGILPGEVVVGNGSTELVELLVRAFVEDGDEVVSSYPSFLIYQKCVQARGGINRVIPLKDMAHDLKSILAAISLKTRLIFLDNPNNPTGTHVNPVELYTFFSRVPEHVLVVLDQAYVDFMEPDLQLDVYSLIRNREGRCGVVFLRTFSTVYGLSGLRVGFGLMAQEIAECVHKVRQPFNVNSLAQAAAGIALEDREHYRLTIERTVAGRAYLMAAVDRLGCISYPSQTNFVLIDVLGDAEILYQSLFHKGVRVRPMAAYGYPTCIRVTIGTDEENDRFLAALSASLKELD